ncbi:hypothetical protein [Streptomyces axinellae]|uniref:Uncharacterized protein n=1 Tax=Streptomyces axinellae TaxID=552788 RepID=A0ABP6DEZ8_9ACTN
MRDHTRPLGADEPCPLCLYWRCRCDEIFRLSTTSATPADSDPDMDEALRRVRAGGAR